MGTPGDIEPLDLASLVSSRLCHDVISPVGAIINGLEVLEEENDAQMREFALDLIKKSARQASARLQFARLSFGAAGSAGASIDLGDAEQVVRALMQGSKAELTWSAPRLLLPKNQVKLLLNLILIAISAIPRGGRIDVTATASGEGADTRFVIAASGTAARIPNDVERLVAGDLENPLDAHGIQPFFTGTVARACAMRVTMASEDGKVTITAEQAPADVAA